MQKIGFIGTYDKIDLMLYIAKILTVVGKRVLIADTTQKQKAKYIVPVINPTKSYVTEFEDIDVAVGFDEIEKIEQYLGIGNLEKEYDVILIDVDNSIMFEKFGLLKADINYFVTSFDVYDLKKGLETLNFINEPVKITKILFSEEISIEEEQYLDFLSRNYKIVWNDYKFVFPITIADLTAIAENQRVENIKFKKISTAYKENLLFIAEEISKDVKTVELRKAMKNLEKGA